MEEEEANAGCGIEKGDPSIDHSQSVMVSEDQAIIVEESYQNLYEEEPSPVTEQSQTEIAESVSAEELADPAEPDQQNEQASRQEDTNTVKSETFEAGNGQEGLEPTSEGKPSTPFGVTNDLSEKEGETKELVVQGSDIAVAAEDELIPPSEVVEKDVVTEELVTQTNDDRAFDKEGDTNRDEVVDSGSGPDDGAMENEPVTGTYNDRPFDKEGDANRDEVVVSGSGPDDGAMENELVTETYDDRAFDKEDDTNRDEVVVSGSGPDDGATENELVTETYDDRAFDKEDDTNRDEVVVSGSGPDNGAIENKEVGSSHNQTAILATDHKHVWSQSDLNEEAPCSLSEAATEENASAENGKYDSGQEAGDEVIDLDVSVVEDSNQENAGEGNCHQEEVETGTEAKEVDAAEFSDSQVENDGREDVVLATRADGSEVELDEKGRELGRTPAEVATQPSSRPPSERLQESDQELMAVSGGLEADPNHHQIISVQEANFLDESEKVDEHEGSEAAEKNLDAPEEHGDTSPVKVSDSDSLGEKMENGLVEQEGGIDATESPMASPARRFRLPDHNYEKETDPEMYVPCESAEQPHGAAEPTIIKQQAFICGTRTSDAMDVDIAVESDNQEDVKTVVYKTEDLPEYSSVLNQDLMQKFPATEAIPEQIFDGAEIEPPEVQDELSKEETLVLVAADDTMGQSYSAYGNQVMTADGQVLTVVSSGQDESVEAIQAFIQGGNEWTFDQQVIQITNPPTEGIALGVAPGEGEGEEYYITSDMLHGESDQAVSLFEVRMPDGSTQYVQIPVSMPVIQAPTPTRPTAPVQHASHQRAIQKPRTQIQRPKPVPQARQYEESGTSVSQLLTSSMEAVDFGSDAGGTYILSHAQSVLDQCVVQKSKPVQVQEPVRRVQQIVENLDQSPIMNRQNRGSLEERVSRLLKVKPGTEPVLVKSDAGALGKTTPGSIQRPENQKSIQGSEGLTRTASSPLPNKDGKLTKPLTAQPTRATFTTLVPKALTRAVLSQPNLVSAPGAFATRKNQDSVTKVIDGKLIHNFGCEPILLRTMSTKKIDVNPSLEAFSLESTPVRYVKREGRESVDSPLVINEESATEDSSPLPEEQKNPSPENTRVQESLPAPQPTTHIDTPRPPSDARPILVKSAGTSVKLETPKAAKRVIISHMVDGKQIFNLGCNSADFRLHSTKKIDIPPSVIKAAERCEIKKSPHVSSNKGFGPVAYSRNSWKSGENKQIVGRRPPADCIDLVDEMPAAMISLQLPFEQTYDQDGDTDLYEAPNASAIPFIKQLFGKKSPKLEEPKPIVRSNTVLTPYAVKTEKKYIYTDEEGKQYEIPAGNNVTRFNDKQKKQKRRFPQFQVKREPKIEPVYQPPEPVEQFYTEEPSSVIEEGLILPHEYQEPSDDSAQQYYYSEDGSVVVNPPNMPVDGFLGDDGYYYYPTDGYFFNPETLGLVAEGPEKMDQSQLMNDPLPSEYIQEYKPPSDPVYANHTAVEPPNQQSDILDLDALRKPDAQEEEEEEFVVVNTCATPRQSSFRVEELKQNSVPKSFSSPLTALKAKNAGSSGKSPALKPVPVKIPSSVANSPATPTKFTRVVSKASAHPTPPLPKSYSVQHVTVPVRTPVRVTLPAKTTTPSRVTLPTKPSPQAVPFKQVPVLLTAPSRQPTDLGPTRVIEKKVAALIEKAPVDTKAVKIRVVAASSPASSTPAAIPLTRSVVVTKIPVPPSKEDSQAVKSKPPSEVPIPIAKVVPSASTPTNKRVVLVKSLTPQTTPVAASVSVQKVNTPTSLPAPVATAMSAGDEKDTLPDAPPASSPAEVVPENMAYGEKTEEPQPVPEEAMEIVEVLEKEVTPEIPEGSSTEVSRAPVVGSTHEEVRQLDETQVESTDPELPLPEVPSGIEASCQEQSCEAPEQSATHAPEAKPESEGPPALSPIDTEEGAPEEPIRPAGPETPADSTLPTLVREVELPVDNDDDHPPVLIPMEKRPPLTASVNPILEDWSEWDSDDERPLKAKKPVLTKTYDRRKPNASSSEISPSSPVKTVEDKTVEQTLVLLPRVDRVQIVPSDKIQVKPALKSPTSSDTNVPIVSVSPGTKQVRFAPSSVKPVTAMPHKPPVLTPSRPIPLPAKETTEKKKVPESLVENLFAIRKRAQPAVDTTMAKKPKAPELTKVDETPAKAKEHVKKSGPAATKLKENGAKSPSFERKNNLASPGSPSKVKEFDLFSTPTMKRTGGSKRVSFSETPEEVTPEAPKRSKANDTARSILKRKQVAKKPAESPVEQPERKRRKKPAETKQEEENDDDFLSGADMGEGRLPGVSSKPCPVCSARYTTPEGLANHIATHTGLINNKKVCPLCTYSVLESKRSKAQIQSHILTSHRVLLPDADVNPSRSARASD